MNSTDALKIFVVDDDVFQLEIVKQLLITAGQQDIRLFEDELEVLRALQHKPDLIFLDHHLSAYSGIEVLRKIKRFDPNISVVIVSGQEDIQTAVESLKYGALDYIQKNENLERLLLGALKKAITLRQVIQESKPTAFQKLFRFF